MPQVTHENTPVTEWFCLRSQPKHEHIAAAHLRQLAGVEVFLPRIRFKRATVRGAVWTTEALFPGYLFARFTWPSDLRAVQHARGVSGIVRFGDRWPTIAAEVIADLRTALGPEELRVLDTPLAPGDVVRIADGSLRGLLAVVAQVQSSRDRVAVLMEFLGRQTMVELPVSALVREGESRARVV
jgi:transcriptional antiterminator RfaH